MYFLVNLLKSNIFKMVFINNTNDDPCVRDFQDLDAPIQELINAAIEARKSAYCPYSKFPVGAALRAKDGTIYAGCNIENASYPAGICAERTAAAKAISEGRCEFVACAVIGKPECGFITPCGICRQFLAEFARQKDFPLYATTPSAQRVLCTTIRDLLPRSFSLKC